MQFKLRTQRNVTSGNISAKIFQWFNNNLLLFHAFLHKKKMNINWIRKASLWEISCSFGYYCDMLSALKPFRCHGIAFHNLFEHKICLCNAIACNFSLLLIQYEMSFDANELSNATNKHRHNTRNEREKSRLPCTTELIRKLSDFSFQTWLLHFKRKIFSISILQNCLSRLEMTSHIPISLLNNTIVCYSRVKRNETMVMLRNYWSIYVKFNNFVYNWFWMPEHVKGSLGLYEFYSLLTIYLCCNISHANLLLFNYTKMLQIY